MQPAKVIRQKGGHGTYDDIARWVDVHYGFKPHASWIAHCKEMAGLPSIARIWDIVRVPYNVLPTNGRSSSKPSKLSPSFQARLRKSTASFQAPRKSFARNRKIPHSRSA